ncbi:molecular chaperone Hsp20 [Candidatus Phytoplasma ziziphi]|uniref:Molecular chaperone Hsp20 n=1 Tax=Ziziphus jujuba witches'-broom phytoplasma TaxID=135727 RepID=A0A660HND7_ZIZJU|nr:Hsp20 family protein [Candidatus Phytoplasma ziziphi]AYJ01524.1 molecular chaperone Hsp20 [Candidatus Phytoplasma ziziphi]
MSVVELINRNQDLLENLFEDFKNDSFFNTSNFLMKSDIKEYNDHYVLITEIPGFKKEEIKISLENGYLILEAFPSKKEETKKEFNYLKKERITGIIRRSFNLGENFNIKDIQGHLENGLLILKINKKREETKPKEYLELK